MNNSDGNLTQALESPAIGALLRLATHCLSESSRSEARLEAEVLLAFVLGRDRSYLRAWPEVILNVTQIRDYMELVNRRIHGEPIAYITGRQEFWSLDLRVTPDTLIPRADTESLVEQALRLIPRDRGWRIADLGTGSGAVAAALASERPLCQILATDSSERSVDVARENLRRLGLNNVSFAIGTWCTALPPRVFFDLILSNPPYVPAADPHMRQGDLPWEPEQALTPGPEGLESIREIIDGAPKHLVQGGYLMLEHGFNQGKRVRTLLKEAGFQAIETYLDLGGRERVTRGRIGSIPKAC